MQSQKRSVADQRPRLVIDERQYPRLVGLAQRALRHAPDVGEYLLEEVERADVLPPDRMPEDVVTIGATVRFEDAATGTERTIELVLPEAADPAAGRVSVVSPVGAALIGLSVGQSMSWQPGRGPARRLTVLSVRHRAQTAAE